VDEAIEKTNKTLARKVAEKTAVGVGTAGAEVISEGVTAIGQYPAEMAAQQYTETGTTEGAPTEYPGGYVQAVKDVAPATLALTGLMGLGAGGVKLASMPFRQQKSPEQIKQDNIDLDAEREANNLMIPPTDEDAKGLQASAERLREAIVEKKEVYSGLEPTDPATQQLGMEIRELERAVQLAEAEIAKRVTPESEQARLAREIAVEQEGKVTKTGKAIDPELTNSIGKMVGLRREGGLALEEGFAYRSVSEGEVGSIAQEGYMITDPRLVGKEKKPRGQTTQKMFSELNPDAPNAAYGKGDIVIRVRKENVPVGTKGQAVREVDVEVLSYDGTQWVAQTPAEFAQAREIAAPPAAPTAEAPTVTPAPVSETITEPAAAEPAGIAVEPETQAKIAALKQGWTDRLAAIPEKNKRQKADAEAMIWNKQSSLDPVERQAAEEFFGERAKTEELGKLQEAMDAENNEKVDFDNARQLVESLTGETGAAIRALVSASPKLASALENIKVQSGSPSFDGSVIRIRRTDNTPQTKAHEATHAILDKAIDEVPAFRDGIGKIIKEFFEITDWNTRIFSEIPTAVRKKMEIVSKIYSQARTNYKSFGKNQDISFSKYFSDNLAFIVRSIQPSMKGYKITDQDVRFAYALTGQHEFLAAIMSDQEFRDFAKELKLYQKPKSLFERFIEAVKSLFGKKPIQAPVTQLDKVMKLVEEAINNEAYQPGPYKREYGRSFELPRKPAAEETGTTPESPEGQSVPAALANGIDIGPENNMPINRKIDSHIKNFLFVRGLFESASDRLRRNGFVKLGDAIRMFYDQAQRRLGDANKIMLPAMEAYKAVPAARKKQIEEDFQTFFAAQENGRDTEAIRKEMDPIARRIVDAWQKFGEESGKENQRVGVKVYDSKTKGWRKIGLIPKFWPRRMKPEYQRALYDPEKYPKEYNEIVEALLEDGKIKDANEAEMYLRQYDPEATKNDYFSGIEQARGNPLPEKLYDYSMQVMTDYIARWAQHVSRIEQFGQKTTEESQTLWDRDMKSTRDRRTIDYIRAAQERVEGYYPNSPWLKGAAALNIWATGIHLGNPASAVLNLIGGSTLNAMIGQPGALGSFIESLVELRKLGANITDAKEKGILGRDLMNIVGDHQAILETNKIVQAGQKTADFLLKWGGFTPAEQMVRTQSLIVGKSFVRKTLDAYLKNPNGSFARRANSFLTRNGFDLDRILVEQGTGPETDRLLRYFANISQGSYTIDQVPLFIDMPEGRFLLKYQKFSTQVMRMSWKNTFEPLFKAMTGKGEEVQIPDKTRQLIYKLLQAEAKELGDNRRIDMASVPKTATKGQARALALIPAMMWLGSAYVGGEVLLRLRDMLFGVLMKGPEYEDMLKALEDDDLAGALYLFLERAWTNLIGIGALGLIGNYAQFFFDWQDRERVKNPLEPPALSIVKDFVGFVGNAIDQRTITAGDIEAYASSTLSAYRATKRFAQSTAGFMGLEEIPGIKQEMFRREVANINKYARRWAEDSGIEYRTRRPGDVSVSPRTPVNRKIASYMQTGEPVAAATYAKAYIKGLPKDEQDNARQSILTGARNRQPLRLGSRSMAAAERKAFLTWIKDKVNDERFKEISELDAKYQKDYKTFLSEMGKR
jgi:hypothetical protein